MSKKDLISHWDKPTSAYLYEMAHDIVLDRRTIVPSKYWQKFKDHDKKLQKHNVSSRMYAFTVLKILEGWMEKKGFKWLPINVYCGDWAFRQYMQIHESESVVIHSDDELERELIYTELIVSKRYIDLNLKNGIVHKFSDVVKELEAILDPIWLKMYESGAHRPQTIDVLEILEDEYNVTARSIVDIVTQLVLKQ